MYRRAIVSSIFVDLHSSDSKTKPLRGVVVDGIPLYVCDPMVFLENSRHHLQTGSFSLHKIMPLLLTGVKLRRWRAKGSQLDSPSENTLSLSPRSAWQHETTPNRLSVGMGVIRQTVVAARVCLLELVVMMINMTSNTVKSTWPA